MFQNRLREGDRHIRHGADMSQSPAALKQLVSIRYLVSLTSSTGALAAPFLMLSTALSHSSLVL